MCNCLPNFDIVSKCLNCEQGYYLSDDGTKCELNEELCRADPADAYLCSGHG